MDHSIGTLTPVRIASISREAMMDTFARHPRISAALWWSSMQEEAMLQEFRRRGLLTMEHRVLHVLDPDGLRSIAAFNKDYLQLGGAPEEIARYFDGLERQTAWKPSPKPA